MIEYKIQKLKNKLNYTAFKKYFMEMHILGKVLIAASVVSVVVIIGYLGFELTAGIIALTKGIALTSAQFGGFVGIGIALGVIILSFSIDAIISLWQASKNKEKL